MKTALRLFGPVPFLLAAFSGCATSPPVQPPPPLPVTLPPAPIPIPEVVFENAELARASLVARMVIAAPQSIVSDLNALSDHLAFPIKLGNELRSRVGALGNPSATFRLWELSKQLDPMTPSVIVWLLAPQNKARGFCAALTFVETTEVRSYLHEFGKEQSFLEGISERIDVQGNRLFLAVKGRTLLVANSPGSLRKGGPLAMEAQQSAEQVEVTVWPEVFINSSGLTAKTLAAFLVHQLESNLVSTDEKKTPALRRVMATSVDRLAQYFSETQTISLSVSVDNKTGVVVRGELVPRSSTPFAELTAHPSPISFDRSLPTSNDRTWFGAWGEGGLWKREMPKLIRSSGPGGERFANAWEKFYGERVGHGSCILELSGKPFSLCSFSLRPNVSPANALEAFVDYVTTQSLWSAELDGQKAVPVKVKRSKGYVAFEKKIDRTPHPMMKLLKAFFDGEFHRMKATVKDGKLILVQSGQAIDLSRMLTQAPSTSPPPILTHTIARSEGADLLLSIEPASLALNLLPKVGSNELAPYLGVLSGLPGIESLNIPLVFSVRSGGNLKGEWHVPLKGLESLAQIIRGVMGPLNQ
jgi:hypothetical protein